MAKIGARSPPISTHVPPRIVSIFNQAQIGGFRSLHMMSGSAFQTEHDWRLSESQQLRSIAGYQVSGAARFIANWSTH